MSRSSVRPSPIFLAILAVAVIGGVLTTFNSTTAWYAGTFLLVIGGWAATLCFHEFSHAIVAYRGGDYAVRHKGYLTLDIRRYTDPVFSLVLPLLLLAFGGIPLPGGAVWINHHALRSRRVESMVSLAGPLSNLAAGIVLTLVVRYAIPMPADSPPILAGALSYLAFLQFVAFLLNILPVPGLDGWGALEPWLSPEAKRFGAIVRPWAPLVLFALLIGVHGIRDLFFGWADSIFTALGGLDDNVNIGNFYFLFWQR